MAIGPIEEIAKLLPFVLVVLRFKAFDEPLDGIIYASFIGLGYAASENIDYLDYLTPLSALMHGFYDFLVLQDPTSALPIAAVLIISIWIWRLILMRRLHRSAVDKAR